MKISLLHPSYKRPEMAFSCYQEWMGMCRNPNSVEYILCLAGTDPKLNEYLDIFSELVKVCVIPENGLVKQVNHAAQQSDGDLLIAVSDDFGCPYWWDEILRERLAGKEDYIVKTLDGLQPDIITLPIMDRVYYNRFSHIYHPDYNHMYGDEELEVVGRLLGKLIKVNEKFPHRHYSTGQMVKDETNVHNDSFYPTDKKVFEAHRQNYWGLPMLSLIIPTISKRAVFLNRLLESLKPQLKDKRIEIIVVPGDFDTIGSKRNRGLSMATGKYIAFIDDDDRVCPHYIDLVWPGVNGDYDCVGLVGQITINGVNPQSFVHSLQYKDYFEKDAVLYRPPNHLNVIRSEIAKSFSFPETNFGEDTAWAMEICRSGKIKTEYPMHDILYFYDYITGK